MKSSTFLGWMIFHRLDLTKIMHKFHSGNLPDEACATWLCSHTFGVDLNP